MNTIVLLMHLIRRREEDGIKHLKHDQDMLVIKICVLERKKEERKVDLRTFVTRAASHSLLFVPWEELVVTSRKPHKQNPRPSISPVTSSLTIHGVFGCVILPPSGKDIVVNGVVVKYVRRCAVSVTREAVW
ncbi:hypothetical protein Tco_0879878 [Tanacetum coccineum]